MNEFVPIPSFPNYVISRNGVIKNGETVITVYKRLKDKRKIIHLGNDQKKTYLVARMLGQTFVFNPCPKHLRVMDHINGDCTDDRIENLRWLSQKLNLFNRRDTRGTCYVEKGYNKKTKKFFKYKKPWRARCAQFYIGCYDTEEEAHQAYLKYRAEEFTRIYMSLVNGANVPTEARHRANILRWSTIDGNGPRPTVSDAGVCESSLGGEKDSDVGTVQSAELLCPEVAPNATKKSQEQIKNGARLRRTTVIGSRSARFIASDGWWRRRRRRN